uniref:Uncharacterized protein n=1 Tax=Arundo donax TaxID=35708 RepID=A0A0A9FXK0_ARUDO
MSEEVSRSLNAQIRMLFRFISL